MTPKFYSMNTDLMDTSDTDDIPTHTQIVTQTNRKGETKANQKTTKFPREKGQSITVITEVLIF